MVDNNRNCFMIYASRIHLRNEDAEIHGEVKKRGCFKTDNISQIGFPL